MKPQKKEDTKESLLTMAIPSAALVGLHVVFIPVALV